METSVQANGGDNKVSLLIQTPVGKWQHPFRPATTISEVIAETIQHFHGQLTAESYELRLKGSETALDVNATLVSLNLDDRTILILVPAVPGGGR